eukprot:scaffold8112_cov136-Isochrysis_galbana.AAC.4
MSNASPVSQPGSMCTPPRPKAAMARPATPACDGIRSARICWLVATYLQICRPLGEPAPQRAKQQRGDHSRQEGFPRHVGSAIAGSSRSDETDAAFAL